MTSYARSFTGTAAPAVFLLLAAHSAALLHAQGINNPEPLAIQGTSDLFRWLGFFSGQRHRSRMRGQDGAWGCEQDQELGNGPGSGVGQGAGWLLGAALDRARQLLSWLDTGVCCGRNYT